LLYKYAHKNDYSDLASGKVIYSIPGSSAFPLRLMSEIFQLCLEFIPRKDKFTIYDPCCGSAYHLTGLAFMLPDKINKIICSDINNDIIYKAGMNLSLLSAVGIDKRISEINELIQKFDKDSHKEALGSAKRLKDIIQGQTINTVAYIDNILNSDLKKLNNEIVDIIFADIPYENLEKWQSNPTGKDEVRIMLENLLRIATKDNVIVIASTKKQKIVHEKYRQVKKLTAGKRKISFLKLI